MVGVLNNEELFLFKCCVFLFHLLRVYMDHESFHKERCRWEK